MVHSTISRGVGLVAGLAMTAAGLGQAIPAHAEPATPATTDAAAQVAQMTLEQKVGQLMWTHVYGASADDTSLADKNEDVFGPGVKTPAQAVQEFHLGGVLYFNWSGNIDQPTDLEQVAGLSNGLQEAAASDQDIPLAITVDQEGGRVARLSGTTTDLPGNMALGATRSEELAYDQGAILGREMSALGINVDFAPDMDVNTNPENPVIGVRSIGSDPELVSQLGAAQIRGMQDAGTAASAKHFPGHGDTNVDSHLGLPVVSYDRATLDEHLKPFRAAIEADVDMIMTAHIIVEAIDPEMPGTLSKDVLTGLLREEMGYDGLITTDALDMEGAQLSVMTPEEEQTYRDLQESGDEAALKEFLAPIRGQLAVKALQAGSDILLNTYDAVAMRDAVLTAVADGTLTEERIDESVTRILEWKNKRQLTTDPVDTAAIDDLVGTDENRAVADEIADRSLTLLRNDSVGDGDALPLPAQSRVLIAGSEDAVPDLLEAELTDKVDQTQLVSASSEPTDAEIAEAVEAAESADHALLTVTGQGNEAEAKLVSEVAATGTPVTVISVGLPYELASHSDAKALIAAYGKGKVTMAALGRMLTGLAPVGKLPVDIPADGDAPGIPFGTGLTWGEEPTPTPTPTPTDPGPGPGDPTPTPGDPEPTRPGQPPKRPGGGLPETGR